MDQWITINIEDRNDNPPVFPSPTFTLYVPEAMDVGSSVMALTAEDADIEDNAKLTYTITSGNPDNHFYMDSIFVAGTGVVKINIVRYEIDIYICKSCKLIIFMKFGDFVI